MKGGQGTSELKPASPEKINSVIERVSEGASRYVVGEVERYDRQDGIQVWSLAQSTTA